MGRPCVFRRPLLALALACAAAPAAAQMVGGGVSGMATVQSAQMAQSNGSAVLAQPSSAYSNPYSNSGVARPAINASGDPFATTTAQGAATGAYANPLGYGAANIAGVQTTQPSNPQAYTAAPGYYGGAGEPATAPNYSVQAQPTSGPYAAAPQSYAPAPSYTPQNYAPQPQYAQPYAPSTYGQTPAQQQYGQPVYAQPQYAQPPYAPPPQYAQPAPQPAASGVTPVAMAPGNNLIASPYAAARAAANPGGPMVEGGYTLGPGDKVRLTIFGETDLSGEYQLDGNGNIRVPLAGIVHAAGNTPQGLEAALYAALVPNYLRNPRITVEVTTYRPIYVLGQVQKPGQYAYVNNMTMMNAIGLAGGFTPQAKESTVLVRHEGESKEEAVSTAQPLLIRPGDSIRVDTTLFWDTMNLFSPLSGPAYLAQSTLR
jgi:polysaccharide export outer membrane protein